MNSFTRSGAKPAPDSPAPDVVACDDLVDDVQAAFPGLLEDTAEAHPVLLGGHVPFSSADDTRTENSHEKTMRRRGGKLAEIPAFERGSTDSRILLDYFRLALHRVSAVARNPPTRDSARGEEL
jgi:hypothetical protein